MRTGNSVARTTLLALLLTVCAQFVYAQPSTPDLPEMGDSSASILSMEDEQRIGKEAMRQLESNGAILHDPIASEYIQELGHTLSSSAETTQNHFHFFIVKASTINAFAMPGGYIGVHEGLILASHSENELAAVLAHEIAHVTQHHIARSVERANKMNLPLTAGVIAAILLGGGDPQVANAALAATLGGAQQMQLNFTRSNEKEADRVGMQLLANSDYDPRGMGDFFSRLETETRYAGSGVPEFLRTHPVTTSRIAEAENRASLYPKHHRENTINYLLVKARLRLFKAGNSTETLLKQVQHEHPTGNEEKEAQRYLTALIYEKQENPAAARKTLTALLQQHPSRIAYIHALANLEENQGNHRQAAILYKGGLQQYPGNTLLTLASARNLIEEKSYANARSELEQLLIKEPDNTDAYQLLAKLEDADGNKAASYLAQAEYYYLNGESHSALDQLNMAKRLNPLPHYYASRIDARIKYIKDELALSKQN